MNTTPDLTARSLSMVADGLPSQDARPVGTSTLAASGAPAGAPSTTKDQRCHDPEKPLDPSGSEGPSDVAAMPEESPSGRTKVTGWGPRAQMLLVDALMEAGEAEVAWEVASCGSILVYGAQHATVHTMGQQRRHMGHLAHCGRFQVCPVCTPYIMARRLEALEEIGAELAKDEGLRHFMAVITLRHKRGAPWKALVHALRQMQSAVRRGHPWRNAVAGYIRLLESTYRHANGHHPHEHILVSMRVSEDFDAAGFFAWVHSICKRYSRKARRSCEFTGKWWSEIPRERLGKALHYLGKAEKMGTSDVADDASNPLLEFSTSTKHQPLWCIPPYAYAQVWRDSYRMRWFGVGGVWNTTATAKSDAEIDQEREEIGTVIAHIPRSVWLSWTPKFRREIRALVSNRTRSDAEVVAHIANQGGVAGPPPIPDWGEQAS